MNITNKLFSGLALSSVALTMLAGGCASSGPNAGVPAIGNSAAPAASAPAHNSAPSAGSTTTTTTASGGDNGTTAPTAPTSPTAPTAPGTATTAHASHKHCAWIGADTFEAGKASFLANPGFFDAIHPVWFSLQADGSIKANIYADDADIMAAAKAHNVQVIPLVDGNQVDYIRAAMASPTAIATHAAALTALATQHNFAGLEMDYEHLWNTSDRPTYDALVAAVSTAMHAAGKVVTLAVPALSDDAASGYDYKTLAQNADVLHLMGYDYHFLGGDHIGPIAPKGWINDVVTFVQSLGAPQKFSLGIANYGVGNGWYASSGTIETSCVAGTMTESTDHMTVCPLGHQDAGIAPHCTTAQGDIYFENAHSAGEKAALAAAHGLGGVAYYSLGDEPTGYQAAIGAAF